MDPLWCIVENAFDPTAAGHRETVCTLGNGYLGVRGAPEEGCPGSTPGTFIAGVFDAAPGAVPELVVAPDWLGMRIVLDGEEFCMTRGRLLEFRRTLDMHDGVLERTVRWSDGRGRVTRLVWRRITSMADVRVAGVSLRIVPEDRDCEVVLRAFLDGGVSNAGTTHIEVVARGWRETAGGQTARGPAGATGGAWTFGPWHVAARTLGSGVVIAEAAVLVVDGADDVEVLERMPPDEAHAQAERAARPAGAGQDEGPREEAAQGTVSGIALRFRCGRGRPVTIEKLVGFGTSLDVGAEVGAAGAACADITADVVSLASDAAWRGAACRFEGLLAEHRRVWHEIWDRCDIEVQGDEFAQRAVRFAIFHMVQAVPRHAARASIGARGLSGEGYKGHVFWDTETFVVPFFTYTLPEVARNLLGYRYLTLPAARRNAESRGFRGAMYAWESADTGEETTPPWGAPDPETGVRRRILCGDLEHHITADVAYAVWQYCAATGDEDFLVQRGAEILLETGRFWASRATPSMSGGGYEIRHVIGPDEYHEDVDNNFFTNLMARWNIRAALIVAAYLARRRPSEWTRLASRIGLAPGELACMAEVADGLVCGRLMGDRATPASGEATAGGVCGARPADQGVARAAVVPSQPGYSVQSHPADGQGASLFSLVLEQFDGFGDLLDVDLFAYAPRSRPMEAILGPGGVQRAKLLKQPDVLMALYLLEDDAVSQVGRLAQEAGTDLRSDPDWRDRVLRENWAYYEPRTDHGSSLSCAIHSALASRLGLTEEAYRYFVRAAEIDLSDSMGNAVNGVHMATQGGIWQAVVMGFAGVRGPMGLPAAGPGHEMVDAAAGSAAASAPPGGLAVDPRLPPHWRRVSIPIAWRGRRIRLDISAPVAIQGDSGAVPHRD